MAIAVYFIFRADPGIFFQNCIPGWVIQALFEGIRFAALLPACSPTACGGAPSRRGLSAKRMREPAGLEIFAAFPPACSPTDCGGAPSRRGPKTESSAMVPSRRGLYARRTEGAWEPGVICSVSARVLPHRLRRSPIPRARAPRRDARATPSRRGPKTGSPALALSRRGLSVRRTEGAWGPGDICCASARVLPHRLRRSPLPEGAVCEANEEDCGPGDICRASARVLPHRLRRSPIPRARAPFRAQGPLVGMRVLPLAGMRVLPPPGGGPRLDRLRWLPPGGGCL